MIDQRKYPRFKIPLSARVVSKTSGHQHQATVADCSRGGIGLVVDQVSFSHGQTVQLEIYLDKNRDPVQSTGTVMWRDQAQASQHIGLRFDHIDPESKYAILDVAYDQWREKALQLK